MRAAAYPAGRLPLRPRPGRTRSGGCSGGADMGAHQDGALLLAETAASAGSPSERVQPLLEVLRRVVPFDAAFLAFADPLGNGYHCLASVDLDALTVEFLS